MYFQEWPWVVEFTGDRVNGKMPWKRVGLALLYHHVPLSDIKRRQLNPGQLQCCPKPSTCKLRCPQI